MLCSTLTNRPIFKCLATPLFLTAVALITACNPSDNGAQLATIEASTPVTAAVDSNIYRPSPSTTWHAQLNGTLNTRYDVDLYFIDLFDNTRSTISSLQQRGSHVICFLSAGTYEYWRSDADSFPASVIGQARANWPGHRWLDTRATAVRRAMLARFDLAMQKGCDGVAPGTVDSHDFNNGFSLTYTDQLAYNRYLANAAHARGLSIALVNNRGQIPQLVGDFDFAAGDLCYAEGNCNALSAFINQGKAVLNAEYRPHLINNPTAANSFCLNSNARNFSTLILPRALNDDFRLSCRNGATGSNSSTSNSSMSVPANDTTTPASTPQAAANLAQMSNTIFRPAVSSTWQWQLSGTLNTGYQVDLYSIDLFDNSSSTIRRIKNSGSRVICYMSVGTYEQWRSDAARFNSASLGNALDDWPGERWLDIRSQNVRNVMLSRLNTARDKGCDSIEPDNMDAYTHRTGFPLTFNQQLDYNRFLARSAHERGMSIALKNNLSQVPQLVGDFDFAINESCYQYNECGALAPFINQGKAVLNAEYNSRYWYYSPDFYSLCTQSASRRFSTLVLPVLLNDAFRLSCL